MLVRDQPSAASPDRGHAASRKRRPDDEARGQGPPQQTYQRKTRTNERASEARSVIARGRSRAVPFRVPSQTTRSRNSHRACHPHAPPTHLPRRRHPLDREYQESGGIQGPEDLLVVSGEPLRQVDVEVRTTVIGVPGRHIRERTPLPLQIERGRANLPRRSISDIRNSHSQPRVAECVNVSKVTARTVTRSSPMV